ncbi:MAG: hypothetical protein M1834_006613 [Cirrosporium novae-zelandiae]|nr:MAG: hypothetical protein M1834_006613 [Cirrosporium novae-zelandiae]
MAAPKTFEGIARSVISGDTLVIHDFQTPPEEHTLSLAYVSAPRLRRDGDEPFAFQSRDFLRRLCVGRAVQWQVFYEIATGLKREYGMIKPLAASGPAQGPSLPELAVQEGWVRVRDEAAARASTEEEKTHLEKLLALEAGAKQEQKGIWAPSGGKVDVSYELSDPRAFVSAWKNKAISAIVERIIRGDRLLVRLMLSPTEHVQTMLLVGGITAPTTKHTQSDGKEVPGEPFAEEAREFVDNRLLQRNVQVQVLGLSPSNVLVGHVIHPKGSIAKFMLEAGLARCADHHSTLVGGQMSELRQAERRAKEKGIGVFTGHAAPKGKSTGDIEVIVSRVQSADTIYVRTRAGEEKRLGLSSIRQPKPSDPKQAPFSDEAKEYLRKRLIGKHVRISIDGKKPASEGYDEREVATVILNNKNIALLLVEVGYASVVRHRKDDEDRSPDYDLLLATEETAQKDQKGMWSSQTPAAKHYQDYSENVQKAKMQASVLQRQRKIPAVVDFVKSGSRFAVIIPRENAKLTLVLSGIRAPRSARNPNDKSEPFGQEAHDFANRRCMQRDVEIDIETTDKVGGFIGTLYVNRENFAKVLVEEGLAKVHEYSAEQSGNATELFAAEQKAKDARRGLWHDWDPSQDADAEFEEIPTNGSQEPAAPQKDLREVIVTYVDPTNAHLRLQIIGSGTSRLTEVMSTFRAFHLNRGSESVLNSSPKVGDLVAARFTEDNEWYRARIRRNDRENKAAEIVYIDYGNSETLSWSKLRPLTQKEFGPQTLKPQAIEAELSFLQFPVTSPDYLADAIGFLESEIANRKLMANVDATANDGHVSVTLYEPDLVGNLGKSLNAETVAEGCAMIARKLKPFERAVNLADLKQREEEAKRDRRGMWEYGDLTED